MQQLQMKPTAGGEYPCVQNVSYTQAAVNVLPAQNKACGSYSVSGATVNTEEYIAVESDHETYYD